MIFSKKFCRKKANLTAVGDEGGLHRIFPMREKCVHVYVVPWRKQLTGSLGKPSVG